jgi:hypothetical protein
VTLKRALLILLAAGVALYAAAPPKARALPAPPAGIAEPVRGVMHVHTRRSDGTGTVESVARAAKRARLRFVIVTDHGDGEAVPNPPAYYDGVLVIDAVEISTDAGHLVALGLSKTPYPFGGEPRDVVEDIERAGGFAIAAHPASPKPELAWTDWDVPIGGLEYLNGDSEWRDESPWQLARVLFAYPVRAPETLALVFDRQDALLQRWDALTLKRRVVGVVGADAHARLGLPRAEEPSNTRLALPLPGYESVFRAMSLALPGATLTNDAEVDAQTVVGEIRAGRVYTSIDALGERPALSVTATSGEFRATGGEVLALHGPVKIEVGVQAPADAQIVLLRDGARVRDALGTSLEYEAEAKPAVFRVEVMMPGAPGHPPVPWIVSNPIYVGRGADEPISPFARPLATARADVYSDGLAPEWVVEHSSESKGAVDVTKAVAGSQILFRYALSGSAASHPFAALVRPVVPGLADYNRLTFRARADRPMRLSVQLRAPGADADGERWSRGVFVDSTLRDISVFFDEMMPRGRTSAPKPPLATVQSILFVVDTVNTSIGTSGQVLVDDVRYER